MGITNTIPCRYISWNRFYQLAQRLALMVQRSSFNPDAIVAISRGGCAPARVLSDYLGQPHVATMKIEHYCHLRKRPEIRVRYPLPASLKGQHVLLVDDVDDTGDTLEAALNHIYALGRPGELRTAVLHHKSSSSFKPDYAARDVADWHWIIYPWAIIEDLSALIMGMADRPEDAAALRDRLISEHGIKAPLSQIRYVMSMIANQEGWAKCT